MRSVPIADLVTRSPFCDLFPTDDNLVTALAESMRTDGFSPAKPIAVWSDPTTNDLVVADGHQRIKAARLAGLAEVDIFLIGARTEEDAWRFAVAEQRDRRNLTREERAALVLRVYQQVAADAPKQPAPTRGLRRGAEVPVSSIEPTGPTVVEKVAELTGEPIGTVKKIAVVAKHAEPEVVADVAAKKLTVDGAYRKTAKAKKKGKRKAGQAKTEQNSSFLRVPRRPASELAQRAILSLDVTIGELERIAPKLDDGTREWLAGFGARLLALAGDAAERRAS